MVFAQTLFTEFISWALSVQQPWQHLHQHRPQLIKCPLFRVPWSQHLRESEKKKYAWKDIWGQYKLFKLKKKKKQPKSNNKKKKCTPKELLEHELPLLGF